MESGVNISESETAKRPSQSMTSDVFRLVLLGLTNANPLNDFHQNKHLSLTPARQQPLAKVVPVLAPHPCGCGGLCASPPFPPVVAGAPASWTSHNTHHTQEYD